MFNPGPLNRKQAEFLNGIAAQRPVALPQSSFGANPTDWRGGQYTSNIVPSRIFPAKLTAVSGGLYSWTEQTATGADYSGWVDLPGGESGTNTINPAYEPNDVAIDVTDEPVVFLMREYLDETLDWVYVMVGGIGGGGGGSVGAVVLYAYVHIPSQSVPSGARTYLSMTLISETPSGILGTSSGGSETGMYGDAPSGSNFLDAGSGAPPVTGETFNNVPVGGAWIEWDSASTGQVTLELPFGPFSFAGPTLPAFAPGVTQASSGTDRQSVSTAGTSTNGTGFYVAVTQTSGSTRTVEGYAWITGFVLTGSGGGGGGGEITAFCASDATNATNTMANLTALSVALPIGNYAGRMDLWCQNSTAIEGLQFDFNGGSAVATSFRAGAGIFATGSATYTQVNTLSAALATVLNWSTVTGLVNIVFDFSIEVGTAGTLIPRFAENSSHSLGTATVFALSNIRLTPLA